MKRTTWALAAAAGVLSACASAAPALASTYTIELSAPASAVVGQPIVMTASGIQPPPDQYWATAWIQLASIPAYVMTSCPMADEDGLQVAENAGGEIISIALRPNLDAVGNYANLIGYTPRWAGARILCGYLDDGEGLTLARADGYLDVTNPPAASPTPAPTATPRVTRSARRLTCHPGRWSGGASGYAYGWLAGSRQLKGASAARLRVTSRLRGQKVRCSVTVSNAAGSATVLSRPLRVR
jgi:hypothetical protein